MYIVMILIRSHILKQISLLSSIMMHRHQTKNVSFEATVSIYNAIKADIDFNISFSNSNDENYTFIYDKNSLSHKLIPVDDLKSEPVNDHVEINTESCSDNIIIKPLDMVICASNDTTLIEFDGNIGINHDAQGKSFATTNFVLMIKIMIRECSRQTQ